MTCLCKIRTVQSVRGLGRHYAYTRNQIRRSFPSRRYSLARRLLGVCADDCRSSFLIARWGGIAFNELNRATPAHNACAPQWRITKRAENTASGLKTGWLKNGVKLILLNFRARCDAPRARGNGFDWLSVCPSRPKAPSRAHSGDVQAQRFPSGFRCGNRPQPFQQSPNPEAGSLSSNQKPEREQ